MRNKLFYFSLIIFIFYILPNIYDWLFPLKKSEIIGEYKLIPYKKNICEEISIFIFDKSIKFTCIKNKKIKFVKNSKWSLNNNEIILDGNYDGFTLPVLYKIKRVPKKIYKIGIQYILFPNCNIDNECYLYKN